MVFCLAQLEVNDNGSVIGRKETQPLFELLEDAMAFAEFDAARAGVEYGYDSERQCWWARDGERMLKFVVEVVSEKIAA